MNDLNCWCIHANALIKPIFRVAHQCVNPRTLFLSCLTSIFMICRLLGSEYECSSINPLHSTKSSPLRPVGQSEECVCLQPMREDQDDIDYARLILRHMQSLLLPRSIGRCQDKAALGHTPYSTRCQEESRRVSKIFRVSGPRWRQGTGVHNPGGPRRCWKHRSSDPHGQMFPDGVLSL